MRPTIDTDPAALQIIASAYPGREIVPVPWFATNRFEPDTAISDGSNRPEISEAFTVAPEVVYSPTVPVPRVARNKFDPETAMPCGSSSPEISAAFTVEPEAL